YDGDSPAPANLLFDSGGPEDGHAAHTLQRHIDFRGRVWLLEFNQPPPPAMRYLPAWIAFGTGAAISVLVFALILTLLDRQNKARALADELTVDLRKSEQKFREAEARWRAALEGTGLGVWDWNLPEGRVFYS